MCQALFRGSGYILQIKTEILALATFILESGGTQVINNKINKQIT